ncbi:MAG: hypothetical protein AAF311_14155 [Pseudomonadota bacterium]
MSIQRQKFATQMDAVLLEDLRKLAKKEGRQLQSVLEEAVQLLIKDRRGYVMRSEVREAYESSVEQFDDLYKRLSQ